MIQRFVNPVLILPGGGPKFSQKFEGAFRVKILSVHFSLDDAGGAVDFQPFIQWVVSGQVVFQCLGNVQTAGTAMLVNAGLGIQTGNNYGASSLFIWNNLALPDLYLEEDFTIEYGVFGGAAFTQIIDGSTFTADVLPQRTTMARARNTRTRDK